MCRCTLVLTSVNLLKIVWISCVSMLCFDFHFNYLRCMLATNFSGQKGKRTLYCRKLQSKQKILLELNFKIYCTKSSTVNPFDSAFGRTSSHLLLCRNEAGILTARKDLDYIGRDELLEALKRVGAKN